MINQKESEQNRVLIAPTTVTIHENKNKKQRSTNKE